jgi:hypothetical protein
MELRVGAVPDRLIILNNTADAKKSMIDNNSNKNSSLTLEWGILEQYYRGL